MKYSSLRTYLNTDQPTKMYLFLPSVRIVHVKTFLILHYLSQSLAHEARVKGISPPAFTAQELFSKMINPTVDSKGQVEKMSHPTPSNRLGNIWIWNGRPMWDDIFADMKSKRQTSGTVFSLLRLNHTDFRECFANIHKYQHRHRWWQIYISWCWALLCLYCKHIGLRFTNITSITLVITGVDQCTLNGLNCCFVRIVRFGGISPMLININTFFVNCQFT